MNLQATAVGGVKGSCVPCSAPQGQLTGTSTARRVVCVLWHLASGIRLVEGVHEDQVVAPRHYQH